MGREDVPKVHACVPEPDPDMQFKVLRSLGMNLGCKVGGIYSFADLRARCKSNASKINKLINCTADSSYLERQGVTQASLVKAERVSASGTGQGSAQDADDANGPAEDVVT